MVQPGNGRHQARNRKRNDCRKIEEIGGFLSTDQYKMEMMLEEVEYRHNSDSGRKVAWIFLKMVGTLKTLHTPRRKLV
jgi:hypothetical protein